MSRHFKNLFNHSIIYGFGEISGRVAGFLLMPIYIRYFSPDKYGQLQILVIGALILDIFLNLGLRTAFFKYYFDAEDEKSKSSIINTTYYFILIFSIFLCGSLILLSAPLATALFGDPAYSQYLIFAILTSFFNALAIIPMALFRAKKQSVHFSIFSFSKLIMNLGLKIYFVVSLTKGILGVMQAGMIAAAVSSIFLIFFIYKYLNLSFSWKLLGPLLSFGIPIIPTHLTSWLLSLSDRYLLKMFASYYEVGIYSMGHKIGSIVNIALVVPFGIAWFPFMFSISKNDDAKEVYSRVLTYFFLIGCLMSIGLSIFARDIIHFLATPEYYQGAIVVPFIAFSFVFFGLYRIGSVGINITKKTYYFPICTGISAAFNIVLNIFLIPHFGMIGTATAAIISYFLLFILSFIISQKIYYIEYQYRRLAIIVLITIGITALGMRIEFDSVLLNIALKSGLLIATIPMLHFLRFFQKSELASLQSMFNKLSRR